MTKTTEYTDGVTGLIEKARRYNPQIGAYQEHFINEQFGFTARLSNGGIRIPRETAQDYEAMPSSINEERLKGIASTFVPR